MQYWLGCWWLGLASIVAEWCTQPPPLGIDWAGLGQYYWLLGTSERMKDNYFDLCRLICSGPSNVQIFLSFLAVPSSIPAPSSALTAVFLDSEYPIRLSLPVSCIIPIMRLINTETLVAKDFIGSQIPKYAILSHTWEANEATFAGLNSRSLFNGGEAGALKVKWACFLAQKDGFEYTWVDTCCIDKSSSSELTEAINSMFSWYESAEVCHVYLSDLRPDHPVDKMRKCRWFKRGWTLQELIAPKVVKFYDKDWKFRGTKSELLEILVRKTKIPGNILTRRVSLKTIPVGARMSWAANRTTTREEDIAYCLLGIFDVNIPLIYGEGPKAFIRLQEEIIRQTNDLTIFYWTEAEKKHPGSVNDESGGCVDDAYQCRGVLANSPSEFKCASSLETDTHAMVNLDTPEFTITNKGIRINISLVPMPSLPHGLVFMYLRPSRPTHHGGVFENRLHGIYLKRYGDGLYARAKPEVIGVIKHRSLGKYRPAQRYLTRVTGPETLGIMSPQLKNLCEFDWSSGLGSVCDYVSTTPSAWWDSEQKVFLAGSNSDFVACHLFRASSSLIVDPLNHLGDLKEFPRDRQFILVFGITRNEKAWFYAWMDGSSQFQKALEWANLDQIRKSGEAGFDTLSPGMYSLDQATQTITLSEHPGGPKGTYQSEIEISLSSTESDTGWRVSIGLQLYFRPTGWLVEESEEGEENRGE